MEILGYGLRFAPRTDGPTVLWQTLPPEGTDLPRMLNVGFRDGDTFRWGTAIPGMAATNAPKFPAGVSFAKLGGRSVAMVLNNATDVREIVDVREADNDGPWWIRSTQSESLSLDIAWVPTYFVETTPPGGQWSFEIKGPLPDPAVLFGGVGVGEVLGAFEKVPPNALIIVRGPVPAAGGSVDDMLTRMSSANTLVGRGRASDTEWIESASHGEYGRALQRHYVRDVGGSENVVVTGQAPPDRMTDLREYAELIATTMGIHRTTP